MKALEIGQVLYEPPSSWRSVGEDHAVIKIGRKWATLSSGRRCCVKTLILDEGDYSKIKLYLSKNEYEKEQKILRAWSNFRRDVQTLYLNKIASFDDIKNARVLLGMPIIEDEAATEKST